MSEELIQIAGYEMKREIGSGGMARVFLATQVSLGREVAIKVLRKDLAAGGEDFQKRFLHEGQMLAKLVHPNIVAIHDIGQNEEVSYMAMELLKGGTLTERIKKGLSVAEVIRITTQMAHALQLAHDNNIVHRDLKPSNIMFRDEITPVLTDFGIARKTDADHRLTKTGMVVGTPYYMSPEQITGRDIDGRSDIYSLGVMFYELLAGALPFRAEEPLALAMQHVQEPPPPLPDKVAELQPIMDELLAKNPDDRFQTMLEFCEAIKDVVMNETAFREKISGETKLFNSDQFSDPRFGTGGVRVPERAGGQTRPTKRRPAKPPAGGATAVMDTGRGEARAGLRGIGWKIPAAAVAVLVAVAIGAYLMFFTRPDADLGDRERKIVQALLTQANAAVQRGDYYGEGDNNAAAMIKQIYNYVPNHPEALSLAEQIASVIEGEVFLALDNDNTEAAIEKMNVALSIAPDYTPLQELKAEIDTQIAAEARRERLDQLLVQAQQYEEAGRLLEPEGENAYAAYQEILELDNANRQASGGLQRIQQALVTEARTALEAGNLDQAAKVATQARRLFPNSTDIADLRQRVEQAQRQEQQAAEIQQLLAAAERQFEAEKYVYPPGDNALESYQQILGWQSDNSAAIAGLERIGQHFEALAQQAYDNGDYAGAAEFASRGLRAQPDDQQLTAIQGQATGRLDARARQIEQELQRAERLVQEGQFLSGPDGGARDAYQRVLEMDPGNQRAQMALERLQDQVFGAARQLQRDGNYSAADRLVSEAIEAYSEDQRFAQMQQQVAQQLEDQARRLRLEQMLADAQRLTQVRPMTRSQFDQAALALKEMLAEYPSDLRVRAQLGELTGALAEEANRISQQGNYDSASRLIEHGLEQFKDNEALLTAQNTVEQRREQALQEAAARIAAMSGTLAIDAKPWGEVVEIRGADGKLTELPSDATTPLVIPLLEGEYQVVVRGGNSGDSKRLDVNVQRQQLIQARAEFEGMNADTYFQTSGW